MHAVYKRLTLDAKIQTGRKRKDAPNQEQLRRSEGAVLLSGKMT